MKTSVFCAWIVSSALIAFAQTGAIRGKIVTVSGGNPVPKVNVHVKNTTSNAEFSAQSGADGIYTVASLPAGSYELSTDFAMFVPFRQKDIQVKDGQTVQFDIRLSDTQLNTLGDGESREAWRAALVEYFRAVSGELSEDSQERLEKNPLRILDSKDEGDRAIIKGEIGRAHV